MSQDLLALHPSVQDLDIDTFKLNAKKAHYHKLVINHGPLHQPSEHGKSSQVKKCVPKGQTVNVIRNDENLRKAALARTVPSDVNVAIPPAVLPQPVRSSSGKPPVGGASAARNSSGGLSAQQLASAALLPPVPSLPRRPSSVVTSRVSFEASDADSYSVYSCSCCKVKVPSSTCTRSCVNASDYDNLTSVSQRPSNHPSQSGLASVSSSKLRRLEDELQQERQDRLKTQSDLDTIRKRQLFLLSKLTKEERDQLNALMKD